VENARVEEEEDGQSQVDEHARVESHESAKDAGDENANARHEDEERAGGASDAERFKCSQSLTKASSEQLTSPA
jgi:hypothetical protein